MVMAKTSVKPVESFCLKCGRMLPIEEFYKSPNPNHAIGVQPYCKGCANELVNLYLKKYKSMEAAIYYTCADMGVPFIRKLFNTYMEKIKNFKTTANYWGNYTNQFQQNRSKAEKEAWINFAATDTDFKDIAQIQKAEKAIQDEMDELRYRWGNDKDTEQLKYLESRWAYYVEGKEIDVSQESVFRSLCLAELDEWEGNDVDKAIKRKLDLMKVLGLDKFEPNRGQTLSEQMLEYEIWKMEESEPAEYYEDKNMYKDYRGIHSSWTKEILRPVVNLIAGSKDYDIETDDKLDWEERNQEDLNSE